MSDPNLPAPREPDRIVISSADLSTSAVEDRVQQMAQAQKVALVRTVGAPTTSSGAWKAVLALTLGGALGGVLAFALQRLLLSSLNLFADNNFLTNLTFAFIMALTIGVCVSLAEVVTNRSWGKLWVVAAIAIPAAIIAALALGLLAHWAYTAGTEWLYNSAYEQYTGGNLTDDQVQSYLVLRLHPIRGFAWMLVGVSAGIAAGAASRSWKRTALAVLGGAVGGFLGGFIFDFIPMGDSEDSANSAEIVAQLVGITLLGTLIGLATGLVEQAGKSRWIEIVSGGLAGKQFILYKSSITLGSSPGADITLIKDPSIAPVAATMRATGSRCEITSATGEPVVVNGIAAMSAALADGDVVTLGSSQLRFREKASRSQMPGAVVG